MKLKKLLSIVLVISIFASIFLTTPPDTIYASNTINGFSNPCKYNPSPAADGPIPDGVRPCNTKGFKFNSQFYYGTWTLAPGRTEPARNLIVYGNPQAVPKESQDFQAGWQSDPNNASTYRSGEGRFVQNGVRGEFRYLGFTQDGGLYYNMYFRNDNTGVAKNGQKHWIYRPWQNLPSSYSHKPATQGTIYRNSSGVYENVTLPKFELLQQNMNESLGFTITEGVSYADRYSVLPRTSNNSDPRNYMVVNQAPTSREGGYGTMYHYSWISHKIWYQTFPLVKLRDKNPVPVTCSCEVVGKQPITLGKEKKIEVTVEVTATLQDTAYYNNAQNKSLYYNRDDVDVWKLELFDPIRNAYDTILSNVRIDGVVVKGNTAKGRFEVEIDTDRLDKTNPSVWKFTTNARVAALFNDKPNQVTDNCNLEVRFKPNLNDPMESVFDILPMKVFSSKSEFVPSDISYRDLSYGKDVDYYIFEITNNEDGTSLTRTVDPAIPEVKAPRPGALNQSSINQWIYDFIASKFPSETTAATRQRTFTIRQTIVDKDTTVNNRSVDVKGFVAVQRPPAGGCGTPFAPPSIPQYIQPEADWPEDWYDVVPFPVTDAPPNHGVMTNGCDAEPGYGDFSKRVFINGTEINADSFFQGNYVFGEEQTGLHQVKVVWTAPDGTESFKIKHTVIHETKPRVSLVLEGLYKRNRTMNAYDTSSSSNDQWVEERFPLEITSFSYVNPNDPSLRFRAGYGEENTTQKMFMYKEPGNYQISIAARRVISINGFTITRYSDPYVVDYEILPDHKPAIIAHPYGTQISRLDGLGLFYDVQSTDGDYIDMKSLKVLYDSNNDGTFDQEVFETTGDISELPAFDKLGQYQILVNAKESTNQDRLMEFITPEDDQTQTFTGYFFVDNYAPSSDLYLDMPNQKPDMDVFIMLDANLAQAKTDYVKGNKVNITNSFTLSNMLANIGIWDMKTYTYSQSASTTRSTGTSYPPSTTSYSSNGYSGTLNRTSVSNSPYSVDEGRFVSVTDSKTGYGSCPNTVTVFYGPTGVMTNKTDTSICPESQPYNDGQFTGTVYKTGASRSGPGCPYSGGTPNGSCSENWSASYAGTVHYTRNVWEPNMVTYDSYTGFYQGTIYRDVRAPYDVSFMRAVPTKYFVYISDSTVSQLPDLEYAMSRNEAKLILVGQAAMQSQINHDMFFVNNKSISEIIDDVISYIAQNNPEVPRVLKLLGEPIETQTATFDYEDDAIPVDQLQIIQDPFYYDNSQGFDTFAGQTLTSTKSGSNWRPYVSTVTFNKPGKYTFFRRVQDNPAVDPNFNDYSYYSNEAAIEVFVHRRPIADVILDFDYITSTNMYRTTWVDRSYDLDHNITRAATDRGIAERSIKFTNQGTGEAFTRIPDFLPPGTYILEYMARDIEGEWSDPVVRTFVLPDTVPVQMRSNLRTAYSGFSLSSVPASEDLVAYDLWTRYPYSIALNFQMGSHISRNVPYFTGTRNGNDISWSNEQFTIPATTPDGTYTFRIRANGSVAGSTAQDDYTVRVVTPINLSGRIDAANATNVSSLVVNDPYTFRATTTKYANAVTVTAFRGTTFQRTLTLTSTTTSSTGFGQKAWAANLTVGSMPDGMYTVEWRATTPNGNVEVVTRTVEVVNNRPPVSSFTCTPNPAYEGDVINCTNTSTDPDGDSMTFLWTVSGPNGYSATFTTTNISLPRSVTENRVGTYSVTLRATDSRGRANDNDAQRNVVVQALTISGQVNHTPQWEQNRLSWNAANPGSPRAANTFWAGEGFDLVASPTNTSDAGGSTTTASSISVVATDIGTASLTRQNATTWTGYIGQDTTNVNLEELANGPYHFTFTVTYSNGVQKSTIVTIYIANNWSEFFRFHRRY